MHEIDVTERELLSTLCYHSGRDLRPALASLLPRNVSEELRSHIDDELDINESQVWGALGVGQTVREFLDFRVRLNLRHSSGEGTMAHVLNPIKTAKDAVRLERELNRVIVEMFGQAVPQLRLKRHNLCKELRQCGYSAEWASRKRQGAADDSLFSVVARKTVGLRLLSIRFFKHDIYPCGHYWTSVTEIYPPSMLNKRGMEYRLVRVLRSRKELLETINQAEKLAGHQLSMGQGGTITWSR